MATVTLTWTDPTQRTDGSAIAPDTFAIQIFDSLSPTPNTPVASVASGVETWTSGAEAVGVHQFTVVAVDSEGDASVPSNTASATIPAVLAHPNPPANLAAAVNA